MREIPIAVSAIVSASPYRGRCRARSDRWPVFLRDRLQHEGAVITAVNDGSPAKKGGVVEDDVVVSIAEGRIEG